MNCFALALGNMPLTLTLNQSESSPWSSCHLASCTLFVPSTVRLSTCLQLQRWRYLRKHSRNRPVFLVGLPKATQIISVRSSVSAPSATSQILSEMADASSNTSSTRLPSLCRPAKASELCSDQGTASIRQVLEFSGSACSRLVALNLNQWEVRLSRCHFATSGQVLVRSWFSVFAVTTPFVCGHVSIAHLTIHDTSADLPIPWPDAVAI